MATRLVPLLGTLSRVSEVLTGNRELSMSKGVTPYMRVLMRVLYLS
jgi:antitoxin component HigA of HigAB toxin-antitoxin module